MEGIALTVPGPTSAHLESILQPTSREQCLHYIVFTYAHKKTRKDTT